ncbi:hypothetical protein LAUMK13_01091 [Mycobacterium innocens]|uniref:Uncharacterized protein n=1 Tax=Mycobacterium innocens TaxID=2341083 RepID=A0A498PRR7_9MYCO|nr:hypothetical protein LAUMK13_01091 [Mycobacterium innocens]
MNDLPRADLVQTRVEDYRVVLRNLTYSLFIQYELSLSKPVDSGGVGTGKRFCRR